MTIPIEHYPPESNVVLVPGRIHDMYEHPDVTYDEIFSMPASLPPLSGKNDWHQIIKTADKSEGQLIDEYRDILHEDQRNISNSSSIANNSSSASQFSTTAAIARNLNIVGSSLSSHPPLIDKSTTPSASSTETSTASSTASTYKTPTPKLPGAI